MSLSDNYQVDVSTGNGVTTVFTGSWSPLVASYMRVALKTISTGVISAPLTQGGGAGEYTLSFTSAGYSVTLGTAPSSAYQVLRYREVAQDQTTPYTTAKGFQGAVTENSFDKLTAITQDLRDDVDRSLAFQIGSTASTTMPEPEANKLIGWDSTATALENKAVTDASTTVISSFMSTLLDDSTAAEARTTLAANQTTSALTAVTIASGDYVSISDVSDSNLSKKALVSDIISLSSSLSNDFRLTLTSGLPVTTSDVTGATTIYCTPYKGNRISLYDGANWNIRSSSQFSLALGTLTSGRPYDVFCYDNAGVPTLEFLAWTNDTTRATALVYQDGVLSKTGQLTRRYLGTFYTTSTTTTEDSVANRYLWNYYNRVDRAMRREESTASWNYTTATWRQANAASANQLNFVVGVSEDIIDATVYASAAMNAGSTASVGIGLDSTSSPTGARASLASTGTGSFNTAIANFTNTIAAGKHFLAWLEFSVAAGTTTWGGVSAANGFQSAIYGRIMA